MDEISFAGEELAAELVPSDELADCAATALAEDGARILSYGTGAGYTPLRELLAEQYGVHPYRVLLTNGWLQGFALLAHHLARGRNVVIEYPTYDRALQMLFGSGSNLLYVDIHEDGPSLELLDAMLRPAQKPAFAYTMPTFHTPTGQSLSRDQREGMCALLLRSGTMILEDDSFGLLRYEGERLPTLFEGTGQRSTYSTSFSHTIAPGLRVGVFILPDALAGELATVANSTYISPVLLGQATVFEFLRRGRFEENLEELQRRLAERRDTMLAALERHLPEATWSRPEGGIFVWLRLPPSLKAAEVIEQARGVSADDGTPSGGLPYTMRLNFAAAALDEIETGIERLAAAAHAGLEA
jgi:2-aminoadipate transaminase